jgi:hypothetical protein
MVDSELKMAVDETWRLTVRFREADDEPFEAAVLNLDDRVLGTLREFFDLLGSNDAAFRLVAGELDRSFDRRAVERAAERARVTTLHEQEGPGFEVVNVYGSIPVYAPVHRNCLTSAAGIDRPSAVVPSKEFVNEFKLWVDLPSWNMRNENGLLPSVYLDAGNTGNSEHHLFLRQELIERLLSSQELSVVWIVWGERQHYSEDRSKLKKSPGYQYFRQVFRYRNGSAIRVW